MHRLECRCKGLLCDSAKFAEKRASASELLVSSWHARPLDKDLSIARGAASLRPSLRSARRCLERTEAIWDVHNLGVSSTDFLHILRIQPRAELHLQLHKWPQQTGATCRSSELALACASPPACSRRMQSSGPSNGLKPERLERAPCR